MTTPGLDTDALVHQVRKLYTEVAHDPGQEFFHFELGRPVAERLGYDPADLDAIPAAAIDSFAGVGYFLDLADIGPGHTVLDLGSGSGMDSMLAALRCGPEGRVIGIDMTDAQRDKAARLAAGHGLDHVEFRDGFIDRTPVDDASVDVVVSNGVINLVPDKAAVFAEVARVLRPGGRLALADIVSERPLPEEVTCDATLWASCIGGAMQADAYRAAVEAAGLRVRVVRDNAYDGFRSDSARGATDTWGVKSVSLLAERP